MKVSELMDNDLFMYGGHLCRFNVRSMDAAIERLNDGNCYPPCCCVESEPIPLTEEILKANGFKGDVLHNVGEYKINCVFGHAVYITMKGRSYSLPAPMYVHELQHALRLCGLNELADNFKLK